MQINGRTISDKHPPYIIAELSCNHCGDLSEAISLVRLAREVEADAVKLQCYQASSLTIDCDKPDFVLKDGLWKGRKLYDLYKKCETPREWFPVLFKTAQDAGITLFSSVFSPGDVDFLESLDCPAYKIASMEITDTQLISDAAKTGKPLIISTGMATVDEVNAAMKAAMEWMQPYNICLLHCISGYPTHVEECNLRRLIEMQLERIGPEFGISDHTLGWDVSVAATAIGATVIERHFTRDRLNGSEDAAFSLTPYEFMRMNVAVRSIWQAMQRTPPTSEEATRQLRRSLYAVENIANGELFTEDNVRSIRPSYGLPPSELSKVLGRVAKRSIERGTPLTLDMIL